MGFSSTQTHTQMSQQPVAAGEDASSVAKRVHLFLPSHSEPTSYGVPLHLPVIMPVLMEAAYSGNKEAAPAPPPSLHRVFRSLGSILEMDCFRASEKVSCLSDIPSPLRVVGEVEIKHLPDDLFVYV